MSIQLPTDSETVILYHQRALDMIEQNGDLRNTTNCDACERAFPEWDYDDSTPLVRTDDGVLCESCAHDGTVDGAVCSDHPDIRLSDGCYKCDPNDYIVVGGRHVSVTAVPLNIYAAANHADINHDGAGTAHLQHVIDVLTERIAQTENVAAAWQGILDDPGYGPDHDDLADFVWQVADDATSRLVYHGDIVDAYAGVCGWREEADIADDGLFLPEQTIEQRMLVVLFRVAERFAWGLIATLRRGQDA